MKWTKSVEFLILGIGRGTTSIHDPPLGVFLDPPLEADNVTVQPSCQAQPEPLPETFSSQDVSFDSKNRACARSCLQLRDQGGAPRDGIYWLTGMPVPVLCDFSHDGGGWTLLLTANSKSWDLLSVKSRREGAPTMADDYSILRHADAIRDLGNGTRFAYRIEAQAETGRQRWGGVWLAAASLQLCGRDGRPDGRPSSPAVRQVVLQGYGH
ncbi:hypothetical protein FJT64_020338 [Amphibalanus amphitrite]|uniref:Fibrinogen C-terminal domain-containing protein n=1 Tax=Amphibalanus amphitrite TaxID=1232801 RepID=A0A6A4WXP9_AMPAM|nr:hypothetical protein FJT64_020338 [Amphibalanus amphitrite]